MPADLCEHQYPLNSLCPACERDELGKRVQELERTCWLDDPEWKQCCCNCVHHKPTHEHCSRNMPLRDQIEKITGKAHCICHIQNGWACCLPEGSGRIYTHWPEHSVGCECYEAKNKEAKSGHDAQSDQEDVEAKGETRQDHRIISPVFGQALAGGLQG